MRKDACLVRLVSLITQFSRGLREVKLNLQALMPQDPAVLGQVTGLFYVIGWNIAQLTFFKRVVVKHVQPRGKLGHQQRSVTVGLDVALGRGNRSLTPVLPAVVKSAIHCSAGSAHHKKREARRPPKDTQFFLSDRSSGGCLLGRGFRGSRLFGVDLILVGLRCAGYIISDVRHSFSDRIGAFSCFLLKL